VHWVNNQTAATAIIANAHQRNGDALCIDLNNNFSQFICTRLYEKIYNIKNFVHRVNLG